MLTYRNTQTALQGESCGAMQGMFHQFARKDSLHLRKHCIKGSGVHSFGIKSKSPIISKEIFLTHRDPDLEFLQLVSKMCH